MDQRSFTFLCYGLITAWVILMAYVILLLRREQRLQKELDRVQRQVEGR